MIGRNDAISLAPGVHVENRVLIDSVRGLSIPLSDAAAVALRESTPARMGAALAATFDVDRGRADADARAFCAQLNRLLLANVRVAPPRLVFRWAMRALMLAQLHQVPRWPPSRRAVSTRTITLAIASTLWAARSAALAVALTIALPLLLVGVPRAALLIPVAAAAGMLVHEAGHAATLRGVESALIVRGVRVALLHSKLDARREAVVAAAGPLAAAFLAALTLAVAMATAVPAAAFVPLPLALHAFGLTVISPDGRKICAVC